MASSKTKNKTKSKARRKTPSPDENDGGTRDKILKAAVEVFGNSGFQGARTTQIASLAGVPQPLLYFHFKDKKDLWRACAEHTSTMGEDLEAELAKKIRAVDAKTGMKLLLEDTIVRARRDRHALRFWYRFGMDRELDGNLAKHLGFITGMKIMRELVQELSQQGAIRVKADPGHLIFMIIGSALQPYLNSYEYKKLTGKDPFDADVSKKHLEALIALFVND